MKGFGSIMNIFLYYAFVFIIEAIIFYIYCYRLFGSNDQKIRDFFIILLSYSILIPIALLNLPWLNCIGFFLVNILLLYFLKHARFSIAFFHTFILIALMSVSELIVMNIIPNIRIRSYREINTINNGDLLFLILNKILYLISSQLAGSISRDKSIINEYDKSTLFLSIVSAISASIIYILLLICLNIPMEVLYYNLLTFCAFLLLVLTLIIFAMHYHYQLKAHEYADMQLQLQKEYDTEEYYKAIISNDEQQHILIHDIKNHLITLAGLNETGDKDNVDKYIQGILSNGAFKNPRRLCDHKIMNIILTRYMNLCQQNKITFTIDIRSNTLTNFTDEALTTLFCNLLDNAFAAAKSAREHYDMCDKGERDKEWEDFYASYITLDVKHSNTNQTLIVLVNSCTADPFSRDGRLLTTKSNKRFHGYGLRSVRNIVERNNGSIEQYYKEECNEFHTIILM